MKVNRNVSVTLTQLFLVELDLVAVEYTSLLPHRQQSVQALDGLLVEPQTPQVVENFPQLVPKLPVVLGSFLLAVLYHIVGQVHERQFAGI